MSLANLIHRVQCAIDHATEGSSINLSSSQRNIAKKHAWGSCSTIGMLLGYSQAMQCDDGIINCALLEQFRCVQLSHTIHEKIVAAAVHSLVSLPDSFWHSLPDSCESIGHGLASSLCYLFKVSFLALPHWHLKPMNWRLTLSMHVPDLQTKHIIAFISQKRPNIDKHSLVSRQGEGLLQCLYPDRHHPILC